MRLLVPIEVSVSFVVYGIILESFLWYTLCYEIKIEDFNIMVFAITLPTVDPSNIV